jgi:YVTN family beta-propeller protein
MNSPARATIPVLGQLLRRRSFLVAFVLSGCRRKKGTGFLGYALVANSGGNNLAAVDLARFFVARTIPLGASPSVVIGRPGKPAVCALTPLDGTVHEVSLASLERTRQFRPATQAVTMRITPAGDALWVLASRPARLLRVNLENFRISARIELPAPPVSFDLSPDGTLAAVSLGEQGVCLAGLNSGKTEAMIRTAGATERVCFRSDGRQILAALPNERLLAIIDVERRRTLVQLALGMSPRHFAAKADGGQIFVTGEGLDAVAVVYPYSTEVAETLLAGASPGAMTTSANPDYLFVANAGAGSITIFDIETRRLLALVQVGEQPCSIHVTPDNQYALVLNRGSGDMAVIRLAALSGRRMKAAPLFTVVPVGSMPVHAAIQGVS